MGYWSLLHQYFRVICFLIRLCGSRGVFFFVFSCNFSCECDQFRVDIHLCKLRDFFCTTVRRLRRFCGFNRSEQLHWHRSIMVYYTCVPAVASSVFFAPNIQASDTTSQPMTLIGQFCQVQDSRCVPVALRIATCRCDLSTSSKYRSPRWRIRLSSSLV